VTVELNRWAVGTLAHAGVEAIRGAVRSVREVRTKDPITHRHGLDFARTIADDMRPILKAALAAGHAPAVFRRKGRA
jgi:hypothetical protein